MDNNNEIISENPALAPSEAPARKKFNKFALLGILLAVAAWVILTFNGQVALGFAVVSFICACVGLKASTRTWRNTAITALVASAVLMIVLSAFLTIIYVGLK